ncbi:hypothetical protein [Aliamphritea spongicola]|nr:hypothetical protein [Aliamphritea spongicola]
MQRLCKQDSVWFEPGGAMFADSEQNKNYLRLGYSSINQSLIPEGIAIISKHVNNLLNA